MMRSESLEQRFVTHNQTPAGGQGAPRALTLKSIPTVEMKLPARKAPSLKRTSKQVLPTPESPTSITCIEGQAVRDWVWEGHPPMAVTRIHPKNPYRRSGIIEGEKARPRATSLDPGEGGERRGDPQWDYDVFIIYIT